MEVSPAVPQENSSGTPVPNRWRKATVTTSVVLAMLFTGTGLLPGFLFQSSYRNTILSKVIGQPDLQASCEDAGGGWMTPLIFRNVRIEDPSGRILISIRELRISQGLGNLLASKGEAPRITLTDPEVDVRISQEGEWPKWKSSGRSSGLEFAVENGSLRVSVPWRELPIVDLTELMIGGRIAVQDDGVRTLIVDPVRVFDRKAVSDAHSQQNLALIAPVLSQSTRIQGEASIQLEEIRVPLEGEDRSPFPIRGHAEFHTLDATLRKEWTKQLTTIMNQLTGTAVPDRIKVIRDTRVDFEITEDGVFHEGMVFLLPQLSEDISVKSSGLIHLNDQIDLQLAVSLPSVVMGDNFLANALAQLTSEPVNLRVTGTVSKPQVGLPEGLSIFNELGKRVIPAEHVESSAGVTSAVIDLIRGVQNADPSERPTDMPGSMRNLFRAIEESAKARPRRDPNDSPRTRRKDRRSPGN